jgi:hypothetical protein
MPCVLLKEVEIVPVTHDEHPIGHEVTAKSRNLGRGGEKIRRGVTFAGEVAGYDGGN